MSVNAAHVLDDFLESIETAPAEIRSQLASLAEKDAQYEEARKTLFKKRNLYLRAEEKGLDTTLQAALLRKTEKEHIKLLNIIDEKVLIENKLISVIEGHLGRLEGELSGKLAMNLQNPYGSVFADIPEVEQRNDRLSNSFKVRSSPKKRQTLTDEPIDPNEPVYCYCKQVSYGDMVGCDYPDCAIEWFHYSCVGLLAPPKGKWYCKECQNVSNILSE